MIRTDDVNIAPMGHIETTAVQSATPANVDTVLVDGRIVKRGGKLVGYDVPKIVTEARRFRASVESRCRRPALAVTGREGSFLPQLCPVALR